MRVYSTLLKGLENTVASLWISTKEGYTEKKLRVKTKKTDHTLRTIRKACRNSMRGGPVGTSNLKRSLEIGREACWQIPK